MHPKRLVYRAAKVQYYSQRTGSLFMDAPRTSFDHIKTLASDRKQWEAMVSKTNFNSTPSAIPWQEDMDSESFASDTSFVEVSPVKPTSTIPLTIMMKAGNDNTEPVKTKWAELMNGKKQCKKQKKGKVKSKLTYEHKAAWHNAHHLKHHGPNADPNGHGDKFIVGIPAPILHDLLNDIQLSS